MTLDPAEIDALAISVSRHLAPLILSGLSTADALDPLLTVSQAAKEMNLSSPSVRKLIRQQMLSTVPGLTEIRIKRSVARAFGNRK